MTAPLFSMPVRHEQDVVATRQRARQIAELVGFERIDQTRIATAVSEVARNAFMYAHGGQVEYLIDGDTTPQVLTIRISDSGGGIRTLREVLSGRYTSDTGMGIGLAGARRLMDRFSVDSSPRGTTVTLAKLLPSRAPLFGPREIAALFDQMASRRPDGALEEIQQQNHELLRTLDALRARQEEVERINRELEDTNRGVVALYAELDERAEHLRRADDLKTKFLSNMTHEFRTPVNSILALSQLLAERLQTAPDDKNELFYLRKSAQQLSDLVDDLLDIAKVEAGKIDVRPTHFEVAGLFGALRGMLRPLLVGHSLSLVFEDPADLPPLYTDETKVSQILRNFISNALKYTERGEVRVAANFRREAHEMQFIVSDTGIGIPAEDLPRIFDEFVQIENPLQRRTKGTGLGLPLSRRLAELLGGRITVESTLGQGSTFTLALPLLLRPRTQLDAPTETPPGHTPILIVEDSDEDILIYHRLLAGSPFQILHASSMDEALHILRNVTPGAIVLDVRLHGQDAWELLARLKREAATADVPVIVASTADHRRKAFSLGADDFGLKPIDRTWLLRTLQTLVRTDAPLRALVIDDEEAFRFIMTEMLRGSLFESAQASRGEEALALAREFRPDIVLLDLQLPDISGYEVSRRLREDAATAHVAQIVVTSQHVSPDDHKRLGDIGVLAKSSLSRETLRNAIRDALLVSSARPNLP
jgi:signal transduction histidine kinase/DNA-binding response OmpR family regulator